MSNGLGVRTELRGLREVLKDLYPTPQDARRVADDAGVDTGKVLLNSDPTQIWHDLLRAADLQGRLRDLVEIAREDHPKHLGLEAAAARLVRVPPIEDPVEGRGARPPRSTLIAKGRQPVSAVHLRGGLRPSLVERLAHDRTGRFYRLPDGDAVVLFGVGGWRDQAAQAAAAFAVDVGSASLARSAGVATDVAIVTADAPSGPAIERSRELAEGDGACLDEETHKHLKRTPPPERTPTGHYRIPWMFKQSETLAPQPTASLHGRGRFIDDLLRQVQLAEEGQAAAMAVLGAPGIGKSRLRRQAIEELLRRGVSTVSLIVRANEARRGAPFAALRTSVEAVVGPDLARVVFADDIPLGDMEAVKDRRLTSFRLLLELLTALSTRGTIVLAVDDAQWLDESSRDAIRWVYQNASGLQLAVWIFARPDQGFSPDAIIPCLGEVTTLPALNDEAAMKLLREIAGEAPPELLELAGGHPLFLEELGKIYRDRGPAVLAEPAQLPVSIEGCFLAHCASLGEQAVEFAVLGSVFGRQFWADAVAYLGATADATTLREVTKSLLKRRPESRFPGADEFAFRSGIYEKAAYRRLDDEARRAALHRKAAEWLAHRAGVTPDELARHYDRSGDDATAAEHYANAAAFSARNATVETTCAQAQRALELATEPAVRWRALVARDDVLMLTDKLELRKTGIAEMEKLAPDLGQDYLAEALWRECHCARLDHDNARAIAAAAKARALAAECGDPRWGVLILIELATLYSDAGDEGELATVQADLEGYLARGLADEGLTARVHGTLGYLLLETGNATRSLESSRRAAEGYGRTHDERRQTIALVNAADALLRLGRIDAAHAALEQVRELAARVGNARTVAVAGHNLATVHRMRGELAPATSGYAAAAEAAERLNHVRLAAAVATERVYLALQHEEAPEVLVRLADEAERRAERAGSPNLRATALACKLRAHHRAGVEASGALAEARKQLGSPGMKAESLAELSVAVYETGGATGKDRDLARTALERLVAEVGAEGVEGAQACRVALRQRFLVPEGLMPQEGDTE